jgi:hypothetical protein
MINVRRTGMIAAVAGVLAVCTFGWWAILRTVAPEIYIDIDQAQIQQRLAARFPQHNCLLATACVDVSDPEVILAEGTDRIGFTANVAVTLGHRQMPGRVAFSGVLRYVRYQGDFYLEDIRVDDLKLSQFPPELAAVLRMRGPAAMQRALEGHPVYTLKGDTAREALLKLAVSDVRVVNGRVRVTFLRLG